MEPDEIIKEFHKLYGGTLAQQRRDAGDPAAMPPWAETYWLGKQVVKNPMDLWVYQEIMWETKPELIVECGTNSGGSAFYFATIMDLIGYGQIITIDKDAYPHLWREHPRITYLVGDSLAAQNIEQIRAFAGGKKTMLSLDSLHTYEHVKAELAAYADLTAPGCYCVVEDTGANDDAAWGSRAVAEFLVQHPEFVADLTCEKHLFTSNHLGWLRRNS